MDIITMLLGIVVGVSLGLTGGGGAIFAVPLLVYVVGIGPRQAIDVSLLTVGLTALVGFVQRARKGLVEFTTGLVFAIAGMIGAPIGSYVADFIPETILLIAFAFLMLAIALRMWFKKEEVATYHDVSPESASAICVRDPQGELHWTSPCAVLLMLVGLLTGFLAGMFGVGGGFIIVPALVAFSCMSMKRAISTSLLVMTLVSASGLASHIVAGKPMPIHIAALFSVGSLVGLMIGSQFAQRLSGEMLQRVFAGAIVVVALVVLTQSALHH